MGEDNDENEDWRMRDELVETASAELRQLGDRELEDDFWMRPEATAPYDFVCRSDLSGSGTADVPGEMGDKGDLADALGKPALYDALRCVLIAAGRGACRRIASVPEFCRFLTSTFSLALRFWNQFYRTMLVR